jgi:hypothetical protein
MMQNKKLCTQQKYQLWLNVGTSAIVRYQQQFRLTDKSELNFLSSSF